MVLFGLIDNNLRSNLDNIYYIFIEIVQVLIYLGVNVIIVGSVLKSTRKICTVRSSTFRAMVLRREESSRRSLKCPILMDNFHYRLKFDLGKITITAVVTWTVITIQKRISSRWYLL